MGRKCAVPHCYTGYRKCQEKAPLYRVPDDDYFLSKWQEAISREDRPITPKDYVCGKHFKEDDILRTRTIKDVVETYQRPRLKPDAIPSVFPELPEYIPKMVKKRRKMDFETETNNKNEDSSINTSREFSDGSLNDSEIKNEPTDNGATAESENILANDEIEIKNEAEESMETSSEKDQLEESYDEPGRKRKKMHCCNHCDYKTKYPHNLRTHQAKHSSDDAYMCCPYCPDYKTKWELTFKNHLKNKHGIRKPVQTSRNNGRQTNEQPKEIIVEKHFKCEYPGCEEKFSDEDFLKDHQNVHKPAEVEEKQKHFKCTECNYETNSKTHILKHIKSVHITGDDTLVSVSAKNLDITNRRNGKSIYKCLKCPYKTRFHTLLLKHIHKHNVVVSVKQEAEIEKNKCKVWKCPRCPYATFFEHALESHRETECKKNAHKCNDCTFTTDSKPDYLKHISIHKDSPEKTGIKKEVIEEAKVKIETADVKTEITENVETAEINTEMAEAKAEAEPGEQLTENLVEPECVNVKEEHSDF